MILCRCLVSVVLLGIRILGPLKLTKGAKKKDISKKNLIGIPLPLWASF